MRRAANLVLACGLAGGIAFFSQAQATGLTTCDSGPQSGWRAQDALQQQLTGQGWQVRRIKVDGGCYEVYAIDDKGARVEAYFHPVTFEPVQSSQR